MLAEIFLLKLEAWAREANGPRLPVSETRLIPINTQVMAAPKPR